MVWKGRIAFLLILNKQRRFDSLSAHSPRPHGSRQTCESVVPLTFWVHSFRSASRNSNRLAFLSLAFFQLRENLARHFGKSSV